MTDRPAAAAIPEPEVGLRPQPDAPIETQVRPVTVQRRPEGCPHGLAYIVVDGEHYHHEDGAEEFAFIECRLTLLSQRKAAR